MWRVTDAPPRYWTREFTDVYVKALESDPSFQKATKSFSETLVLRCLDTPDRKDVEATYRIDRGRVKVDVRIEDAPSRALRESKFDKHAAMARTTAPYSIWVKLDRGEMNVLQAIASPDYHVEGPKLKIVTSMGVLNAMSAVASRLPKSY